MYVIKLCDSGVEKKTEHFANAATMKKCLVASVGNKDNFENVPHKNVIFLS